MMMEQSSNMVIVAPVDRSDRAEEVISESKQLADAFDEIIHVVHVLTRSEFINLSRSEVEERGNIDIEQVRNAATDIAADAVSNLTVTAEVEGLMGDPASEVIDYANKQDARYIVVAGRKRSPTGKVIFGSISQSILLNSKCPVVVTID